MASYEFNDTAKSPSLETKAGKLGQAVNATVNDTVQGPTYMSDDAARYYALMQLTGMDAVQIGENIKTIQSPEGQASKKNIEAETQRYLGLLKTAGETGQKLEDIMDAPGLAALNRFVASAEGPVARMVPTVTEIENGRERGYDLYSLLMKKRIVLLEGQVDDTMASIANASLLYLASGVGENKDDHEGDAVKKLPIKVYVNSPGGSVLAGLSIYDTMRSIEAPIRTIGMGMQASMGSILLVAGDERMMTRNSYYMVHQPLSGNERSTQQTDIAIGSDFTARLREQLTDIYVRHTGLNHAFWDIVLERDTWLSAQNALDMGIIQDIIVGTAKKTIHEDFSHRSEKDTKRLADIPKTAEAVESLLGQATGAHLRPELVVALSKFEKFWTPSRKAEYDRKQALSGASNDDKKPAKSGAKKSAPTP
ncbi:MAG TPA: ATP-dependent Clp protease proteolytic subunit [Patescibacteria group bacterium]|nr:ATP-dependent Clp protease proteolytic subunit [Patescibacteria group bacterium]